MKPPLLILLFVSVTFISQAQSIKGKVTSEGNVLEAALMRVGSTADYAVSSAFYQINLTTGNNTEITAGRVGDQSVTKKVENGLVIDFELMPISLAEVSILGTRRAPRSNMGSPVPINIIDINSLSPNMGQTSMSQLLQYSVPAFNSTLQTLSGPKDHLEVSTKENKYELKLSLL